MYHYTYPTPLGPLTFCEDEGRLASVSVRVPPRAGELRETALIKEARSQLEEYLEGRRTRFDLPLAPRGTDFQRRVWRVLRDIPCGQTRTYRQVAEAAGNPRACRAVGMACRRNPLLVVIPCHRVVGSDGSLTGYAAGLPLKERLLRLEGSLPGDGGRRASP